MHSEKCPICEGTGKGGFTPDVEVTLEAIRKAEKEETDLSKVEIAMKKKPCHGCSGKGWVEVREPPVAHFHQSEQES